MLGITVESSSGARLRRLLAVGGDTSPLVAAGSPLLTLDRKVIGPYPERIQLILVHLTSAGGKVKLE